MKLKPITIFILINSIVGIIGYFNQPNNAGTPVNDDSQKEMNQYAEKINTEMNDLDDSNLIIDSSYTIFLLHMYQMNFDTQNLRSNQNEHHMALDKINTGLINNSEFQQSYLIQNSMNQ